MSRQEESRQPGGWLRRVCPHNPLYLISLVLVLYGVQVVSSSDDASAGELPTRMLMAYTVMLAVCGWLVVRVGRVWEDARTILLAVLLVFAALSASYDRLCLDDPVAGAWQLASAMAFCVITTEVMLAVLRLRLPLRYRGPFYLQLAVLFAFPAWLGRLSLNGQDEAMCLGVLAYSACAGAALLTLWPAVAGRSLQRDDNGTPWPWPYYPWSVFVFMAIAMSVRCWSLSVSFTHAKGLEAAFHPYFLAPIVLAAAVLLLEAGLRHASRATQRAAAAMLIATLFLAMPGDELSRAQGLSISYLESRLAGPPLLACVAVAVIAAYAALRRASWAEPVVISALSLGACLDPDTRSLDDLHAPADWYLVPLGLGLLARGTWLRDAPRLTAAAAVGLTLWVRHDGTGWLAETGAGPAIWVGVAATLAAPLACQDAWSRWWRLCGPGALAMTAPAVTVSGAPASAWAPDWFDAAVVGAFALFSLAYWGCNRARWQLLAVGWTSAFSLLMLAGDLLEVIRDPRLRRGLLIYAAGCAALAAGLAVSFWRGGFGGRVIDWLAGREQPLEEPLAQNRVVDGPPLRR